MVWAKATWAVVLSVGLLAPQLGAQIRANSTNLQGPLQVAVTGGYLGVGVWQVDAARARELRLPEVAGVVVTLVRAGSPADAAGLRVGDVLVEFDQKKVVYEQFTQLVRDTTPGRTVRMRIIRNGVSLVLTAKIASVADAEPSGPISGRGTLPAPADRPDVPQSLMTWRSPVLGVEAEALYGQMAEYFGVKEGVLVRSVTGGMPAGKAGLKAGDVILRVEKTAVATPSDVTAQLIRATASSVKLSIMREHREITVTVPLE